MDSHLPDAAYIENELRESEARFRQLAKISSDNYWEMDDQYRYTLFTGFSQDPSNAKNHPFIGTRRWDHNFLNMTEQDWSDHIAMLEAHNPFHDLELCRLDEDGNEFWINVSGEPVFDACGTFKGYRGVGKNITTRKLAGEKLLESEARFRSLLELSSDTYWEQDEQYRFTAFAGLGEDLNNVKGNPFLGRKRWDQNYINMSEQDWAEHVAQLDAHQPFHDLELCRLDEDGSETWITVSGEPVFNQSHVFKGYRGVGKKITERKRAEQIRLLEHAVTRCLAEAESMSDALEAVIRTVCETQGWDLGRYFRMNDDAQELYFDVAWNVSTPDMEHFINQSRNMVFSLGEGLVGRVAQSRQPLWIHDASKDSRTKQSVLARRVGAHGAFVFPCLAEGKTIGVFAFSSRKVRQPDEWMLEAIQVIGSQIGQFLRRKQAEERIQHMATHDHLTGLANRSLFSEVLNLAIQNGKRNQRKFAVLFIDLDRFKLINDTLGHEAGDHLLQEIAKRLKVSLRASDLVARLGGDEFVVLLQEVDSEHHVALVARKLLSAITKPVILSGEECRGTGSIGISIYPGDGETEQSLMKNADTAMYLAKEEGKNNYQFFSEKIRSQSLERLTLENSLRNALEQNQFFLHYQAKLNLNTGEIRGVEALLRWQHPNLGIVSPSQFLPIAEESGLIVPIGRWALKTACSDSMAWQKQGLAPVCVAVNLCARQFNDPNLLKDIATTLEETGLAPELLELEVTESMLFQDPEQSFNILSAIKAIGVRLAIDDFGAGYSSLAQLRNCPIDAIKVDRSFIRQISRDDQDRAITEVAIAMGKTLSLTVIAEGVETQEQEECLRHLACDEIQGCYFSKPLIEDEFAMLLRKYSTLE